MLNAKIFSEKISKYRNEIYLIYKTGEKGRQKIFGKQFVENNRNNIELIINGIKNELIDEYELDKGDNNVKLIIKNNLINLENMFYECQNLYNIEELRYLNTNFCTNFNGIFYGCPSLTDIKALEKWNVSNGIDFGGMFYNCNLLSDIKPLENWDLSNCKSFYKMFSLCYSLSDIKPLEKWDVSNFTNFGFMFSY